MASLVLPSALSPTEEQMTYSASSPLLRIPLDDPPDAGRLGAAVWQRVERAHHDAVTRYSEAEVIGSSTYEGIIPAYCRVCLEAGLDAVLVVAMMLHESDRMASWWAGKPRRNPAGIFVTGATRTTPPPAREGDLWQQKGALWVRGQAYPNWVSSPGHPWRPNSVDAHVWRVLGYAKATLDPDRQARYVQACQGRPLPWFTRGSARTPRELGKAHNRMRHFGSGWASPGDRYGDALAAVANALMREAR